MKFSFGTKHTTLNIKK